MNRKQKLLLNTVVAMISRIVAIICGFVLPQMMISHYGSAVNGLISSVTHFLGFISLLELGIGPVIQASLYKPLATKDHKEISRIVKSATRFFRKILYIFLLYIIAMMIIFPTIIITEYEFMFTASLILIISISTIIQYMFGATYQLLLNADQKGYIQNILSIITVILNTVVCVVLMKIGASVQVMKLASSAVFVLRPIGQFIYVKKHYMIDRKIRLNGEPIKQKWNGVGQHVASIVCSNVDIFLLTLLAPLETVSVYTVYYMVISGITTIMITLTSGISPYLGNIIATSDEKEIRKSFEVIEFFTNILTVVFFTCTAVLIVPFVQVYTLNIHDADYYQPLFGFLLTIAYAIQSLRTPYFCLINTVGHFKQTQNGAFITPVINVVISLILVKKFGLIGVAIGTMIAMSYHTIYFVVYLRKNILNRPISYFLRYLLLDSVACISSVLITSKIKLIEMSFKGFILMAVEVFTVVVLLTVAIFICFWRKEIYNFIISKKANRI